MIGKGDGKDGQIILVDKPVGWTSFDVVKKVKGLVSEKKVGHAGALDPLATGLLILCTGKKTKQISEFQDMEKEYAGVMELGKTTPSIDLETEFDSASDISHVAESDVLAAKEHFVGSISQTPPVYSALKVNGERLYHKARRGEEVEIKARQVFVYELELPQIELPLVHFRMVCSKGVYVRSIVRDLGQRLGVGAYLKELRRVRIGPYHVKDAITELSPENFKTNEDIPRR